MSLKSAFKALRMGVKERALLAKKNLEDGNGGLNDRAAITADSILGLVIVVVVAAAALPMAITTFFSANTSGWTDPATVALWGLIPMIIIAVIVLKFWKGK